MENRLQQVKDIRENGKETPLVLVLAEAHAYALKTDPELHKWLEVDGWDDQSPNAAELFKRAQGLYKRFGIILCGGCLHLIMAVPGQSSPRRSAAWIARSSSRHSAARIAWPSSRRSVAQTPSWPEVQVRLAQLGTTSPNIGLTGRVRITVLKAKRNCSNASKNHIRRPNRRGGLDSAIETVWKHGGYVSRGRKRRTDESMTGTIWLSSQPARILRETKMNIEKSDGTVILSLGCLLSGGTKLTQD
jgi:Circularly permutated YpsA SLOG family